MNPVDVTTVERTGLGSEVQAAWENADNNLLEPRSNYWINLAFYLGHQWIWWSSQYRQIQSLAARRTDSDRVRAVVNIIRPRIQTLRGRLSTQPLTFEVRPSAIDDATMSAANISEHVLRARHHDDGWEELRTDNLFSCLMGGTALLMVDWDKDQEEAVLDSYNLAEFTIEPGSRRPRDARWMILARTMTPGQAKARYKLDFVPEARTQRHNMTARSVEVEANLATVYQFFQRPCAGKKGRVATIIDGKEVEYEDWPYPFDTLPGYVFRMDPIPQQWFGDTPMNGARGIQAAYNTIRSTMLENAKLAGNNRLLVPIGSGIDDFDLTDEPGEIVPYNPDGQGSRPDWLRAPDLPRDFRYETERLEREMDDILFTHATSRGQAPGDRNSGLALSILAEKDDTPLSTFARDQKHGWETVASQVLQLYGANVKSKRSARVPDSNTRVPVTIQWNGKALGNETDVVIPLDAVMPHSRAAMQAMLMEFKQTFPEQFAGLDNTTLMRMMGLADASHFRQALDDDVAKAVYENTMMAMGEVMLPEPWHDHARHMAEHNRERNSERYALASEEARDIIDTHIMAHEAMMRDEVAHAQMANAAMPGLAAMPQGNEPVGSLMPRDHIDANLPPAPALPAGPPPPR